MEGFYDSLYIHRVMLCDDIRNQAYRKSLLATVKPGNVVLDFGAGTGILSMFAAQAGASHVFAVERTDIVFLTRKLIEKNGFADCISVIQEDIEVIRLPRKVDVIVSEWLGTFGVDENMLAPLLVARDRWLKPEGKMLPESVSAWMSPLWTSELDADMCRWRRRPYDLDLALIADGAAQEMSWASQAITGDDLMAEPQRMWTTDVYSYPAEKARLPFRSSLKFMVSRPGKVNALISWFSADFGAGITLTNSPTSPKTHWGQYVFPLERAFQVGPGHSIRVEFICIPNESDYCSHAWSVRINDGTWEHHDTRRVIWYE